jgi:dipeptidyl aminopeptidase/acylaminoacyl peptidase
MQDDIDDSIMDLVKQGIVAPDKVAIFGWSYGGYAAFAGATRAGAPYKCAVAGAGISDIGIMRGRVGESRFLRKYQEPTVNGFSPISRVDAVKIPMLIVHGEDDSTVPVEQSRRFYNALKDQQGADVKYIEIEDMFHSPWRHEHNMAWYPDLMTFLGSKCGF